MHGGHGRRKFSAREQATVELRGGSYQQKGVNPRPRAHHGAGGQGTGAERDLSKGQGRGGGSPVQRMALLPLARRRNTAQAARGCGGQIWVASRPTVSRCTAEGSRGAQGCWGATSEVGVEDPAKQ